MYVCKSEHLKEVSVIGNVGLSNFLLLLSVCQSLVVALLSAEGEKGRKKENLKKYCYITSGKKAF